MNRPRPISIPPTPESEKKERTFPEEVERIINLKRPRRETKYFSFLGSLPSPIIKVESNYRKDMEDVSEDRRVLRIPNGWEEDKEEGKELEGILNPPQGVYLTVYNPKMMALKSDFLYLSVRQVDGKKGIIYFFRGG